MTSALPKILLLVLCLPYAAGADELHTEWGGHTKLGATWQSLPDNSVLHDVIGGDALDSQGELRLDLELRKSGWSFDANYQLALLAGDSFEISSFRGLPSDDHRLFDLTDVIDDGNRSALLHRLDRLWIGYANEKTVIRFGRQALSWGNGLFYAPMDLVNPFNPATIDTEYKAGDDMLYAQYLRDNGADVQGAFVIRRDLSDGDVHGDAATVALKYHGFAGAGEFDLLVAEHYGDTVLGLGGSHPIGGAHWSADLVYTDTDRDSYIQLSTNLSYSWVGFGRNMSGVVEYHYNGFGVSGGRYDPLSLALEPDLVEKLARGETFTVGRHYLAGSITIEMTPLWTVSPTLLANAEDPSALLQLVTNYSLGDNMTLLGSLNVPVGSSGTEFGGIETGLPDRYLSTGVGIFAQLAWYF